MVRRGNHWVHGWRPTCEGDKEGLGFRVAQTPRFPQTPEIQVSVMFVPHMTGSCCTHHVDMFRVKGFLGLGILGFGHLRV